MPTYEDPRQFIGSSKNAKVYLQVSREALVARGEPHFGFSSALQFVTSVNGVALDA
jgi:hypothetical protein